jgi:hypothetical protein
MALAAARLAPGGGGFAPLKRLKLTTQKTYRPMIDTLLDSPIARCPDRRHQPPACPPPLRRGRKRKRPLARRSSAPHHFSAVEIRRPALVEAMPARGTVEPGNWPQAHLQV